MKQEEVTIIEKPYEEIATLEQESQEIVTLENVGSGTGIAYKAGDNIKIENNVISVITTNDVEQNNTKPITSAGVYTTVGNINELLKKI